MICKGNKDEGTDLPWSYHPIQKKESFNCYERKDELHIIYLNCIMRNAETSDGYAEEKVTGPDILDREITQTYLYKRKKNIKLSSGCETKEPLYRLLKTKYPNNRVMNNNFRSSNIFKNIYK